MNSLPIYFSHGYRDRETVYNKYFGVLIERFGFIPSLDPPSGDVNSAKLEKHLRHTVGLIAIVTNRDGSISPYIRYEIDLAIRGNKPVLVFLEDTVPDSFIPSFILRKRFSSRSFYRDYHEHLHALEIFKSYIGSSRLPRYQSLSTQKSALLIGFRERDAELCEAISAQLNRSGFEVSGDPDETTNELFMHGEQHFRIANTYLAISLLDNLTKKGSYLLGALRSVHAPTIPLSKNASYPLVDWIPAEFQRRIIPADNFEDSLAVISSQISLFEEDFVSVDDEKKWEKYVHLLTSGLHDNGEYTDSFRQKIIHNIYMGDTFSNISGNVSNKNTGNTVQGGGDIDITGSFIEKSFGKEAVDAMVKVAEIIRNENNPEAKELFDSMKEELQKEKPRKSILSNLWTGITTIIPLIKSSADIYEKVAGMISKL